MPYSYSEESFFFNQAMFDLETRRKLFQLRQQLTLKMMDGTSWRESETILKEMTRLMELPVDGIGDHLRNEFILPFSPARDESQ